MDAPYVIHFAGASTFPGLKKYIIDQCKTRVLAFLHIAQQGLASAGCVGIGNHLIWVPDISVPGSAEKAQLCI